MTTDGARFTLARFTGRPVFDDGTLEVVGVPESGEYRVHGGTVYFAVLGPGSVQVRGALDVDLEHGMYGCAPAPCRLRGRGARALLVTMKRYRGVLTLGGPLEREGRLRYIDGCTDTGLIAPLRQGDPCLNALFFPPGILQSAHTHPSHRIGVIVDGHGWCHTAGERLAMQQGMIFVLPPDVVHHFETDATGGMRIVVAHPDSDVGPTDEVHQMKRATILESTGQPA